MKPHREPARHNQQTYFVSSQTWERRPLFRNQRWAELFVDTLLHYKASYQLHQFVLMPDHFHLLISPATSLEKAIQFIKGGFSHRAKAELRSNMAVWQRSFTDHRIRDASDYQKHISYIWHNPVKKGLCSRSQDYPYSSATGFHQLDPIPQWLKPLKIGQDGTAEAAPLQSESATNDY